MHERAVRKRQQWLGGQALGLRQTVKAILINRIADVLREIGFQFHRGDGDAVKEQHEINAVLVVQGITHLPDHAQAVGGIARENVRIDRQRRFELGEPQRLIETEQFDAVAEHIQRPALVKLIPEAGQQSFTRFAAVMLGEDFPGLRLRGLHPRQHIRREDGQRAVVAGSIAFGMKPAVGGEVLANLDLKIDFLVQGHAASIFSKGRTSIWPVTAAEIRAVRRSCSRLIARWASAVRVSMRCRASRR